MILKSLIRSSVIALGFFSFGLKAHAACYSTNATPGSCQFSEEEITGVVQAGIFMFAMSNDFARDVESEKVPDSEDFLKIWRTGDLHVLWMSKLLAELPCTSDLGLISPEEKKRIAVNEASTPDSLIDKVKFIKSDFEIAKEKPYYALAKTIVDGFKNDSEEGSGESFDQAVQKIKNNVIPKFMQERGLSCVAAQKD